MANQKDQNKNDQKNQNGIKENDVEESEIEEDGEVEEFEEFAEEDLNYDEGIFEELEFEDEEARKELEKLKAEKLKHRRALKKLKFEREDLDVAKLIGFNNYAKLVFLYGGTSLYLPQHEKLVERKRRAYIYNVYLAYGSDMKKTTSVFGLSESTVRRYVADERKYQLNKLIKERKKQN